MITVKDLHKSFNTLNGTIDVLKGISQEIDKGEKVVIVGPSGSGKSTFLRCLNLLEQPTSGEIWFEGEQINVPSCDINKLRRKMGMVFQHFNLFPHLTVRENITLAPVTLKLKTQDEADSNALTLLKRVGLEEKAEAYPGQLSGGQKQRVAIARALATNPKVLLCDEATSALDPTTTTSILALLKDINQRLGITIIVITHQMSVIEEICNRVAIIDESRIAESGTVEDIFYKPKTEIAQKLVYPSGKPTEQFISKRCMRIVFDGNSSFEPVIANMVLECKAPVNIMYADTKNIDGKAFGQMVVQLPQDEALAQKMFAYVRARGLSAEEVNGYVG